MNPKALCGLTLLKVIFHTNGRSLVSPVPRYFKTPKLLPSVTVMVPLVESTGAPKALGPPPIGLMLANPPPRRDRKVTGPRKELFVFSK